MAIKICKLRGVRTAKVLDFININKFKVSNFDTVVMFGKNFGLFGNLKRAKILLKKLHRIASKNAIILAEAQDPYNTKNRLRLQYQKANRKKGKLPGQLTIRIRYKNYIGDWFDYLFASKKEVKVLLEGTNWTVERFIESGPVFIAVIKKESVI